MTLFRKEAIDFQRDKYFGEVIVTQPKWHSLFLLSVLAIVVITGLFLTFGKYSRKQTVSGYLLSKSGVSTVQSAVQGTVKEIYVQSGDTVTQGQELLFVENGHGLPQGKDMTDSLTETLQLRINGIESQKNSILNQNRIKILDYQKFSEMAEKNKELLIIRRNSVEQRFKHSLDKLNSEKIIHERNLISKSALEQTIDEHLRIKDELNEIDSQLNNQDYIQKKANLDSDNESYMYNEKITDLNQRQLEVKERLINFGSQKHLIIKSPVAGKISFINIEAGQQISDDVLLAIIPVRDELEAELLVPPSAIGFIDANQRVFMRYSSFPYQKFGLQIGEIYSVSQSALLPQHMRKSPVQLSEPAYKVRVKLDKQTVTAYGKEFMIKPGMTLDADVELEQRSLFEWFLEPIFSLKGRI